MVTTRPSALNREQRRELARRLRVDDPGLTVVHPTRPGSTWATARTMSPSARIATRTRSVGLSVSPRTCTD
jgi:hypothetical protein